MSYTFCPSVLKDEPFLWEMLYHAAHMSEDGETSPRAAMTHPGLAQYVKEWGRPGDMGVIAIEVSSGQPIGAAWLRRMTGDERGYGYVDDAIPELSIAVLPAHTGNG